MCSSQRDLLISTVENALSGTYKPPFVVAIDGSAASGKTTLAREAALRFGCGVVHADDFFLPCAMRTPERLAEPGGNFHRERFYDEVILPLRRGSFSGYNAFHAHEGYTAFVSLPEAPLLLVEGAYCHHPALGSYANLRIFYDIDPALQHRRILARNGPEKARQFAERWIPMERAYHLAFGIREKADLVLTAEI